MLVKLTIVILGFFSSVCFCEIYFFTILYFDVKLLAFELCDFFTFVSFGLSQVHVNHVDPG